MVRLTEESALTIPDVSIIESSAELLYGLVHQRYIVTKAGLQAMVSCPFSSTAERIDSPSLSARQVRERILRLVP